MDKLFKLREWLTLPEAAAQLSSALSEDAAVVDILHLALAGRITLAVHFVNHCQARLGKAVPLANADLALIHPLLGDKRNWPKHESYSPVGLEFPRHGREEQEQWIREHKQLLEDRQVQVTLSGIVQPDDDHVLQFSDEIETLSGVWDLPMLGAERLDIERRLQRELDGPEVTLMHLDGAFVRSEDGKTYAWLRERNPYLNKGEINRYNDPAAYIPSGGLPEDAVLVVRPRALADFIATLDQPKTPQSKPLDPRERTSLLRIIRALDVMAELPDRGAATSIETQLQILGFDGPKDSAIRSAIEAARALEPSIKTQ